MKFLILPLILFFTSLAAQTQPAMDYNLEKINEGRTGFNTLGDIYPANNATHISAEAINGVNCYWFTPNDEQANTLVIYLHGGAYTLGSLNSHKALVSHLVQRLQIKTLFINYSLAPEKPFPQGKNDVLAVYKEIVKRFPNHKIIFIGDSAGGGLTVSSIFYISETNLPLPDAAILISPWINLKCNNRSYAERQALDPVLTQKALQQYAGYYAPNGLAAADASELKFKQFPPVFIGVGSNEILYDDSNDFYNIIKPLQANTVFKEYKDQTHVWPMMNISSEASVEAMNDIATFLKTISKK